MRHVVLGALLAGMTLAAGPAAAAPMVSLGRAGEFAVLGLEGVEISMSNPQTRVTGSVGLGPNNRQSFSDGVIEDFLVVDPSADNSKSNNVLIGRGVVSRMLAGAVADALGAAGAIANAVPDQTLAAVEGPTLIDITGLGPQLIALPEIRLSGGEALTLRGGPGDLFIFDVAEDIVLSNGRILIEGIGASHVLFRVGGEFRTSSPSTLAHGTFLVPDGKITIAPATIRGALIGGGDISLVSGARVEYVAFVPEPASIVLFASGLLLLGSRRRPARAVRRTR